MGWVLVRESAGRMSSKGECLVRRLVSTEWNLQNGGWRLLHCVRLTCYARVVVSLARYTMPSTGTNFSGTRRRWGRPRTPTVNPVDVSPLGGELADLSCTVLARNE